MCIRDRAWAEDKVSLQASTKPDAPSGDTSNLSKFLALFDQKIKFDPDHVAGGDAVGEAYHGTFEDMLLHVQSVLAEDQMTTTAPVSYTHLDVYKRQPSPRAGKAPAPPPAKKRERPPAVLFCV